MPSPPKGHSHFRRAASAGTAPGGSARPRQGPRVVATGGAAAAKPTGRNPWNVKGGMSPPRRGGGSAGGLRAARPCGPSLRPAGAGAVSPRRFHGFRGRRRCATTSPLHPWLQGPAPAGAGRTLVIGQVCYYETKRAARLGGPLRFVRFRVGLHRGLTFPFNTFSPKTPSAQATWRRRRASRPTAATPSTAAVVGSGTPTPLRFASVNRSVFELSRHALLRNSNVR